MIKGFVSVKATGTLVEVVIDARSLRHLSEPRVHLLLAAHDIRKCCGVTTSTRSFQTFVGSLRNWSCAFVEGVPHEAVTGGLLTPRSFSSSAFQRQLALRAKGDECRMYPWGKPCRAPGRAGRSPGVLPSLSFGAGEPETLAAVRGVRTKARQLCR